MSNGWKTKQGQMPSKPKIVFNVWLSGVNNSCKSKCPSFQSGNLPVPVLRAQQPIKFYNKYTHTQRSHTQTGYPFPSFFSTGAPHSNRCCQSISTIYLNWTTGQKFLLFSAKLHLTLALFTYSRAKMWFDVMKPHCGPQYTHTHNSSCCTSSRDVVIVCYLRRINKMFCNYYLYVILIKRVSFIFFLHQNH